MSETNDYVNVRGDRELSLRIDYLRLFSVLMIVCFHIAPTISQSFIQIEPVLQSDYVTFLKYVFKNFLPAGSMSVLPAITGLLVFAKPEQRPYMENVNKWGRSLVLPYIVWGAISAFFLFVFFKIGMPNNNSMRFMELSAYNVADAVLGIDGLPFNQPLYFLRNMFVLLLFYPIIGWLTKRLGILPVVILISLKVAGAPLPYFNNSWSIPIGLFLGAYLASRAHLLVKAEKWGLLATFIWVGSYLAIIYNYTFSYNLEFLTYHSYLKTLASFAAIISVWWLSKFFLKPIPSAIFKRIYPFSFPIFCLHAPILLFTWKLYTLGSSQSPSSYFYYLITAMPVVVLICIGIAIIAEKLTPRLWAFVMGQRSRGFVQMKRRKAEAE